jgi:hypothetical protein
MFYEDNIDTCVVIEKTASWNEWEIENMINTYVVGLCVVQKVTGYSETVVTTQA